MGYLDEDNPTPLIYDPKTGLLKVADFLKNLGSKEPQIKALGLEAYTIIKG
ncbi:hypothetical protein [Helicobacter suis]|uniref:hypothetical protein n=1 Tax=Helicobacter suis TaxID=104628 RepID=UPI0013D1CD71|nr:hypothetical protein [Helicobacter suis]